MTIETNLDASSEWEDSQKSRAEELLTVHDTMKLLNDDGSRKAQAKLLSGGSRVRLSDLPFPVWKTVLCAPHERVLFMASFADFVDRVCFPFDVLSDAVAIAACWIECFSQKGD